MLIMFSGANVNGATKDSEHVESHKYHMNAKTHDESESLSDIDDQEVINHSMLHLLAFLRGGIVVCD